MLWNTMECYGMQRNTIECYGILCYIGVQNWQLAKPALVLPPSLALFPWHHVGYQISILRSRYWLPWGF